MGSVATHASPSRLANTMHNFYDFLILAVHKSSLDTQGDSSKGNSLSWAIIIFMTLLGLAIALTPAKRTYEVKKEKE